MDNKSISELITIRRQKLKALRDHGIDPFGQAFQTSGSIIQIRAAFQDGSPISIAGRVTAYRDMGKSRFLDLSDIEGRIQIYLNIKELDEKAAQALALVDIGDFIGVEGIYFTTKSGENSIRASHLVFLSKGLRPLPDKWHGVQDAEICYRQRYLDLIANDASRTIFQQRIQIVREIRRFLEARGFSEVETLMMQAIPGGAAAEPFVTHHNALD